MSKRHKKRKKRNLDVPLAKGQQRSELILRIVATDDTFEKIVVNHHVEGTDKYIRTTTTSVWMGKCLHCGSRLFVNDDGTTDATVEHIVPRSVGGSNDDLLNLAMACERCNNQKGIRHDPVYKNDQRARDVVAALLAKRKERWREPDTT